MSTYLRIVTFYTALSLLLLATTNALSADAFPGRGTNDELIKTQQKADALFEKGDYDRAMLIYRKDLAPLGDKFAQYMTGYMYYSGRGVEEDAVTAYAWYRLAAERSEESFVKSRDALASLLSEEQRLESDSIYLELRKKIGDMALVRVLINNDINFLMARYGSDPFIAQALERSNPNRKDEDYQEASDRLGARLDHFQDLIAADSTATEDERDKAAKLITKGRREIGSYKASVELSGQ